MIVGVDIGGHHVAGARVDRGFGALVGGSYRHHDTDRSASREALLDGWATLIDSVAAQHAEGEISGIGIAMPGPFDYREGTAYFQDNGKFESLYGVNVRDELRRRLRTDCDIRFLNDATAFAVGCVSMGAAPDCARVIGVTLGTGLGAAFLDRGIPVIAGAVGEVPPDGCLWHLHFRDGIADDYVSSRWIQRAAQAQLGTLADVARLAEEARGGSPAAAIFAGYGANLAEVLAPWVRGFGAGAIVLGGRITRAFDLFAPALEQGLAAAGATVPLAIHENTEDAAIVGAARCFDGNFWREAESRLPRR